MMFSDRKLIVYIAMSLDGYIATNDNTIDFLSIVENAPEDYGYSQFLESIDTIIVGNNTYNKLLSMGHDYSQINKEVFVVSHSIRECNKNISFYAGDLQLLISDLKSKQGKHIYCDGGAQIVQQLLSLSLVDELIISIIPILLGAGIRLFDGVLPESKLELLSSKQFEKGLVQVHYRIIS